MIRPIILSIFLTGVSHFTQARNQCAELFDIVRVESITRQRDSENALAVDIPGFKNHPDFSTKMMTVARREAGKIQAHPQRSLRDILESLAAGRRNVESDLKLLIPSAFFVLRIDEDRAVEQPVTWVTGRFKHFHEVASNLGRNQNYISSRDYIIDGQTVRVTYAFHHPNAKTPDWIHPTKTDAEIIQNHAEKLVHELLAFQGSKNEAVKRIAEIHWWLANEMPLVRGSASVVDALTKALMMHFHIPIRNWKPGIAPDIEAFHLSLNEFVAKYADFFSISVD